MEQYILKSALVAEIKKRLYKYEKEYERLAHYEIWITAKDIEPKIEELKNLLSFLDTLGAKEVDFEAEWKKYFEYRGEVATVNVKHLAKHFYELGLKAQKGK